MNVNQNDYVITQPLSFIATTNPISYIGADPIFIDIDSKTMGLCPNSLELFLEKNTEIKGDNCFLEKKDGSFEWDNTSDAEECGDIAENGQYTFDHFCDLKIEDRKDLMAKIFEASNNNWYFSNLELDESKYCDNNDLLYAWSASFGPFIWNGGKVIYHYHIWRVDVNEDIIEILKKLYNL